MVAKAFFHFVDCSIINAFIIHKKLQMQQYNNKNFRRAINCDSLAPKIASCRKNPWILHLLKLQQSLVLIKMLESSSHQPKHLDSLRRCAMCSTKNQPVWSRWMCDVCDAALCLHIGKKTCFKDFHNTWIVYSIKSFYILWAFIHI